MKSNIFHSYTFTQLDWDTKFFGVTSAKAILHKPLTLNEWNLLKNRFDHYQFVSIENRNAEPINSQRIGTETTAVLFDVNIQFSKKIEFSCEIPENIEIHQAMEKNHRIIELAEFHFSKFTEDPELKKRGGAEVYCQWLKNAFGKPDKFYALFKDKNGEINGFLLHSYSQESCVVELIAVSQRVNNSGIGTSLFRAVEAQAYNWGYNCIRVGTQVRNSGAVNFYHKVGCKQIGCHQVYHLWNL